MFFIFYTRQIGWFTDNSCVNLNAVGIGKQVESSLNPVVETNLENIRQVVCKLVLILPMYPDRIIQNRLTRHIIFWIVFVLVNAFAWGFADNNTFMNQLINELWLLPTKLVIVYFNLYYLIPRFLLPRKKVLYFVILLGCYVIGTLLMRWIYLHAVVQEDNAEPFFNTYRLFKYFLFDINFAVIITTGIKLFDYWYLQEQSAREMKEQKQLAEIQLLKSQINPHFLFNTLNNLYSLTLHDPPRASEIVLRLSDVMRYMVHEGSQKFVPLRDELDYLRDYIGIETIRYGNELDLSFEVEGDPGGLMIAPLLLLPFIENIFKHSIEKDPEQAIASVSIKINDDRLVCFFRNNKIRNEITVPSSETGISNVMKRLQLIYPGRHEISVEQQEDFFIVELKITLSTKD